MQLCFDVEQFGIVVVCLQYGVVFVFFVIYVFEVDVDEDCELLIQLGCCGVVGGVVGCWYQCIGQCVECIDVGFVMNVFVGYLYV